MPKTGPSSGWIAAARAPAVVATAASPNVAPVTAPEPLRRRSRKPPTNGARTIVNPIDRKKYRCCAQAFIMNRDGLFLVGTPRGRRNGQFRETVQCGIRPNESPLSTLKREILTQLGLNTDTQLKFITAISPSADPLPHRPTGSVRLYAKHRPFQKFRYRNDAWRSQGIYGQQLFPHLYYAETSIIRDWTPLATGCGSDGVHPGFARVEWGPVSQLALQSLKSKRDTMCAIVLLVKSAAREYLRKHNPRAVRRLDFSPPTEAQPKHRRPWRRNQRRRRGRARPRRRGRNHGRHIRRSRRHR